MIRVKELQSSIARLELEIAFHRDAAAMYFNFFQERPAITPDPEQEARYRDQLQKLTEYHKARQFTLEVELQELKSELGEYHVTEEGELVASGSSSLS